MPDAAIDDPHRQFLKRLARLERVLDPLERLALAEQAQKRLALEIEQVLLAHRRRVRQVAAGEDVGELAADERIVIRSPAGAPREVNAKLQRRAERRATDRNRRARRRLDITFAHAFERLAPWRRRSAARDSS